MESSSLTFLEASSEAWQQGDETILRGSRIIHDTILELLNKGKGGIIGRHGTIEFTVAFSHMYRKTDDYNSELMNMYRYAILEKNAGIFPANLPTIAKWVSAYTEAAKESNALAVCWYKPMAKDEWTYVEKINPSAKKIPLRALEPYYTPEPWTVCLANQKVAVVSSFAETMKSQVGRFDEIWAGKDFHHLTTVDWKFIRSYYSPVLAKGKCEWSDEIRSWEDAVAHLEKQVLESGAKIALLGCGGLAMPLALRLKKRGIISIVMGGAIQILFGIRGKRWESNSVISKFFNAAWTSPSEDEIPRGAAEVEGGCYW